MPLERRKGAHVGAAKTGGNDAFDGNRGNRRTFQAYARESVPTIGLLCMAVIFLCDNNMLRWNETKSREPALKESMPSNWASYNVTVDVERDGFMVLGMHRSGTSMLTGLLFMAAGYTFGGAVYMGKENQKGFFERFDVVGQDHIWMKNQGIDWHENVLNFSWEQALKDKESGAVDFKGGKRALKLHFNNPKAVPWLQKDPRMCIVLKTWLKILDKEPAILFTYRHPLEVALSLEKRGGRIMHVTRGLKLWIAYNMRAIQNSRGLCIVRTSNTAVLADPLKELQRISNEFTSKCGVPAPKQSVSKEEINKFIDTSLQHHDAGTNKEHEVLETYNDGKCVAYNFESKPKKGNPSHEQELAIYLKAMKIYCDLESGKAYEEDYVWPDVSEIK
jgi:hypothetical protein